MRLSRNVFGKYYYMRKQSYTENQTMRNETWADIGVSKADRIRYSVSNMGRCKRENLTTGEIKLDHGYLNKHTGYYSFCG